MIIIVFIIDIIIFINHYIKIFKIIYFNFNIIVISLIIVIFNFNFKTNFIFLVLVVFYIIDILLKALTLFNLCFKNSFLIYFDYFTDDFGFLSNIDYFINFYHESINFNPILRFSSSNF